MPSVAGEDDKPYLAVETEEIKKVSDYTRMSFEKVAEFDCYTFRLLFRDALIYEYKKTEKGREYLEDCYLLTQTEPDREALREKYGGDTHGYD